MSEKQILVLQIWNLDESGFLADGGRCKVLAQKGGGEGGGGGFPIKWLGEGAGCGNITVLAASNASGKAIDLLNIFTCRNFHSSWKGKSHLPSTVYGVSDNGWMKMQVFHQWFEKFCSQT